MIGQRKHHSAGQIVKNRHDAKTVLNAGKAIAEVVQAVEVCGRTC